MKTTNKKREQQWVLLGPKLTMIRCKGSQILALARQHHLKYRAAGLADGGLYTYTMDELREFVAA